MPSRRKAKEDFSAVREWVRSKLVEQVVPSLAVAVARGGTILWEEGFGWADRENRVPATEHTMYSLASISKPITATGLMVLKEQGKLELDTPIDDYLGDARVTARAGDAAEATVRRVANHTSGLPLHYHFFPEDEPHRRPPMDETIRRYGSLVTAPGEKYQYSNLGYGILDSVISRLSGKSYPDFMREQVFLPLGMTRASVDVGPGLEAFQAKRYGSDGTLIPFYDFDHPGGSAVYCSAHDLVRFGMFHLKAHLPDQKPILTDETVEEMQRPTADCSPGRGYGVGWFTNEDDMGYRSVSHGGGMGGVSTLLTLFPAEALVVVALANTNTNLPGQATGEILAALLPAYARKRAELEAERQKQDAPAQGEEEFQPPPELIGEWAGSVHTYAGEVPLSLWFKESGDVHAKLGSELKTLLNHAKLVEGTLTGRMMGDIGTEDARRRPHHLSLDVKLRGDTLNGAMTAVSNPGRPLGNGLSHWVEVKRQ